jgi:zinc protease
VDPHAAVPGVHVNHKVGPRRDPDLLCLAYVEKILAGGESGRLWRRLVRDHELALSLSVSIDERRGPSLFRSFALARPGTTLKRLETEIKDELHRMAAEGPTPHEMDRARSMLAAEAVRATQTTQAVAFLMSEYGLYDGNAGLWREDLQFLLSLDAAAVRAASARAFVPERCSVVTVYPGSRADELTEELADA